MNVPIPTDEVARLQALQQYQILDTPPEVAFERLTQLAARTLNVPLAGVSLLDEKREWFKSHFGWDANQVPRDLAFCAHVILTDQVMVVPDTTQDLRFADNSLVTGPPHIRFYAGAPLQTPDGYKVGTLCILDVKPRQFNASEVATLTDLAAIVIDELELRAAARTTRTQRREVEAHLRQAEENYRGIFEHATEGIFQTSPDGRYLSANPALARIYGYDSPAELMAHITSVGQQLYLVPERRDEFMRLMREHDRVSGFESEVRRKSGESVWISENARAVRDAHGDLLFYEGTVEDITDRKRAEAALQEAHDVLEARVQERTSQLDGMLAALRDENLQRQRTEVALQESQQRLQALFDHIQEGILLAGDDMSYLDANPAACALLGYSRDELLQLTIPDVVPGMSHDEVLVAWQAFLHKGQQSGEMALIRKDGTTVAIEFGSMANIAPGLHLSILRDVTQRQQSETALRESEARFRSLVENAADAFFVLDGRGRIVDANQLACERLGYTREELLQLSVSDLNESITPERFQQRWQALATDGINTIESTHRRKDGTTFAVELRISLFESGGVYLMLALARDITERQQAEAALQRAARENSQLAAAINNLAAGVLVTDPRLPDNPTIFANPGFTAITGYEQAEIIGCNCRFLQGPDTNPLAVQQIREAIEQRRLLTITLLNYRKDGTPFWNEFTINPVYNETGDLINFVGIQTDVTARVEAEEALRAQNRLALFGAEVGTILTEGDPLQVTLQRCAHSMVHHLDAAFARIWTLNVAENVLELQASAGLYTQLDGSYSRVPVSQFKIGLIAAERQPHLTNAVLGDPRVGNQEWARREGMVAFAGYPLLAQDEVMGVMALFARQPLSDATLQMMATVASSIALAIQRHQAEAALRESEARLSALVQSLDDIVFEFDDQGAYVNVWTGQEGLLVRPRTEYAGRRITDILGEATGRPFIEAFQRVISTGEVESMDYALQSQAGLRWFSGRITPIRLTDGSCRTVCMLSRDVTQSKQAALALQQAKDEAERANRAKSEFLSRMSHELRTPLNAILGFAQLFELDELGEEERENVEQIQRAGRHLLGLINEVLEISRIEAGRMSLSLEAVNVAEAMGEVLDLMQPLARQHNIRLDHATQAGRTYVLADHQRLKQVLLNLVSNAVKYNRPDGRVSLSCEPTTDAGLRLEVRDTGLGVSADDLPKLFEPFERLGAEQRGIEGSGIGLALTKGLVELMGGQMGVHSVVGQGSTFWVELPSTNDPQTATDEQLTSLTESAMTRPPRTVLYIEDNLSNLKLIERILVSQQHIRLLAAMQGTVGLELAREQQPDLILLDLHLPDVNGDEVLRRLRSLPETQDIPVVMLSADATPRQIEHLLAAGAADYLTKPLNVQQFLRVLDNRLYL